MFLYNKAAKYYDDAFKTGQHEESKKCSIAAKMLADRNSGPINVDASEDEYVITREIETLMDNARYSDEYRKLDSINALKQEGNVAGFNASIDEELLPWKVEYMKYCKTF